jgi:hypothetical protein
MVTFVGKKYVGFAGVKTGIYYSIEKGKTFEAEEGDIPLEYADLIEKVETATMPMDKVETADAPKRTRTTKK